MTKKEKAKDSRLQRTYNVTLKERKSRAKKQNNKCILCRKKRNAKGEVKELHVDHWHAIANVKIKLVRLKKNFWQAYNESFNKYGYHLPERTYTFKSSNKKKAKKYVRQKLKKMANRGLVCWPCNSGLHRWDDLEKLKRAVKYLEEYFRKLHKGDYDFSHS